MKKAIVIILAVLSSFSVVMAENGNENEAKNNKNSENLNITTNLSGVVLDKITGEVLTGVAVQVEGTDLVAYTDFEGNFEIKGINPGNHNINISYISYSGEIIAVDVKCNKTNKIKVEISESGN